MKQINSSIKTILCLLVLWLSASDLQAQSAQDIINQHIKAVGGQQALSKVKGIRQKQKIILEEAGIELETRTAMALPARYRLETETSAFYPGSIEVLNGSESIKVSEGKNTALSRRQTDYLKQEIANFPSPLLRGEFKRLKEEVHQGKSCFVLQGTNEDKYWIDAETYMLVKSLTKIYHVQVGDVVITTLYSQFKKVGGIYFPHMCEIVDFGQQIQISEIEVNPDFAEDFFSTQPDKLPKPEESEAVVMSNLPSPDKFPNEVFLQTGSYYAAIEAMLLAEADYKANPMFKGFYYEILATDLSIAGKPIEAIKAMDKMGYARKRAPKSIDFEKNKPVNALDEIEKLADQYQAVFVNEAHHVPQHRAFTHQLLQKLYDKGYRYFAAETLMPEDTSIIKKKNLLTAYINEPEYADLIRAAVKIGYQIIPYEQVMERSFPDHEEGEEVEEEPMNIMEFDEEEQQKRVAQREIAQATNLKQKIFDKDPNAKVLVHAGYDHIIESEHMGFHMMANRFKEYTGIDPLTIDQVDMMEKSSLEFSNAYFQHLIKELAPTKSLVLQKQDGSYWTTESRKDKMDMQVFHPQLSISNGRPSWKALGGARKLKTIHLPKAWKGMAEVYVVGEENGVPIDRLYLDKPSRELNFYLPKGSFQLKITDETGKLVHEEKIEF